MAILNRFVTVTGIEYGKYVGHFPWINPTIPALNRVARGPRDESGRLPQSVSS